MKKITFLSIIMLSLAFAVNAQNDTMYVMKNGLITGQFNVNMQIDSIIFYKPTVMKSIIGGTTFNSPILAAWASQFGQTSRASLDELTESELEEAIRNAFAVGFDLSALDSITALTDPVIQAALRLGVPIIFENTDALTSYLDVLRNFSDTTDTGAKRNAQVMATAIGAGVESQISVVFPTLNIGTDTVMRIICLGASSIRDSLSPGIIDFGLETLISPDVSKLLGISLSEPPSVDVTALTDLISSVISDRALAPANVNRSALSSPVYKTKSSTNIPTGVTKKEYLIEFAKTTWYPNGYSQDFVMQASVRVQLFKGADSPNEYVRMILFDSPNIKGFLNRGALKFDEEDDKGYFMGRADARIQVPHYFQFMQGEPNHRIDGAEEHIKVSTLDDLPLAVTYTTLNIDYKEGGINKIYTTGYRTSFRMEEFYCIGYSDPAGLWKWQLNLFGDACDTRYTHRFDRDGSGHPQGYDWNELIDYCGNFNGLVGKLLPMSRGTNQTALRPKVQATYKIPSSVSDKQPTCYLSLYQEAWNVWTESILPGDRRNYRKRFDKSFSIAFTFSR